MLAIFALTYLGIALGRVPGLKVNRTGIALLGAIAIMIFSGSIQSLGFARLCHGFPARSIEALPSARGAIQPFLGTHHGVSETLQFLHVAKQGEYSCEREAVAHYGQLGRELV